MIEETPTNTSETSMKLGETWWNPPANFVLVWNYL